MLILTPYKNFYTDLSNLVTIIKYHQLVFIVERREELEFDTRLFGFFFLLVRFAPYPAPVSSDLIVAKQANEKIS